MMKKILFTLSVLCMTLWSCNTMDLSDVGYGESDRLKSSAVKSLLYGTADGCWKADYQGHEFYFQFHGDGTVTLNSDFLVQKVESKVSFATSGKAVEVNIEECDVHLQNLGSEFVDTKFIVSEVPAEGETVKLALVGQASSKTMELQPTTQSYISAQVASKADFYELFEMNLLDNQVICDASGNLIGYYGLVLNGISDLSIKIITIENKSGQDTKGHTQFYKSQLTKDGKIFKLDTPVSGIKATNGATYEFKAIDCSGDVAEVDGMTGVTLISNKGAVSDFDYTAGRKFSMNQKQNKGDACDEIWRETGREFIGIPYNEMHIEGIDMIDYYKFGKNGTRPVTIWRDGYKNVVYPSSEEGAGILMNNKDKDLILFKNISGSGVYTGMGVGGQGDSTPAECEKIKTALSSLLSTWFSEKGLFVVRRTVNGTLYIYLLCPDTDATEQGGMWMKLQQTGTFK